MSIQTCLRRVAIFSSGVALGLSLLTGAASAAPAHTNNGGGNEAHSSSNIDNTQPQPASNADFSGNGANQHGAYDSTRDGSPSMNGNGNGQATGKPCAGCVGKADNKNPKGQAPDGSDHNNGYECDGNHGVGRSNPAHTGCTTTATSGGGSTTDGGAVAGTDQTSTGGTDTQGSTTGVTPDVPAPKPTCAGGVMTTDVNGDGIVDASDCTVVEGVSITRAAPAVLGTTLSRDPNGSTTGRVVALAAGAARGLTTLATTGLHIQELVIAALLLLAAGFALVRRGQAARS